MPSKGLTPTRSSESWLHETYETKREKDNDHLYYKLISMTRSIQRTQTPPRTQIHTVHTLTQSDRDTEVA